MDTDKTKVVFRVWLNGDVIALLPQIPADYHGWYCQSYMHAGGHSGATTFITHNTRLATPKEYRELKKELKQLGYNLQVGEKCTALDREKRRNEAKRFAQ